ncbi:MAG: phosphoglycolate phosphatase [Verrucomicrobia bacterium]|nr:MAG: phosphoglycolate phosphatase [Verrucomicrobiota bacterium]
MNPTPAPQRQAAPGPFFATKQRVTHVVFDFDGTLSWLRHGWPEMMLDTFAPHLPPGQEMHDPVIRERLLHLILALNGKPTIQQMVMFQEYARSHGSGAPEPERLRASFQACLDGHIEARTARISSGSVPVETYVVAGARALLEHLRGLGLRLYVLSSTVQHRVREEAALLGLSEYFGERIFGSPADPAGYTKRAVFERILREEGISGGQLLAIGDGPVEIADAKALGGVAVAVCTDEDVNGSGICDPFKREQLLAAGADVAIPDFNAALPLLAPLFGA